MKIEKSCHEGELVDKIEKYTIVQYLHMGIHVVYKSSNTNYRYIQFPTTLHLRLHTTQQV